MVRWRDQVWAIPGSVEGLLHWWSAGKSKHWVSRLWEIVPSVVLWSVWRLRNECLFKGAQPNCDDFCEKMKVQIALWVKWSLEVDYTVNDIVFNLNQIRMFATGSL